MAHQPTRWIYRIEENAVSDIPDFQELELEPMDSVARFNAEQDFTKPGVVMGADGVIRPFVPPPWFSGE